MFKTSPPPENVELPLIYQGVRADDRYDLALEALNRVGLSNRVKHAPWFSPRSRS